jgi:hypothetical protein
MGGIVWRLAYESEHPHVVLEGPDIEHLAYTQEYRVEVNGKVYVDDILDEDELALITGEYRQEVSRRDQLASPSWWPSHLAWRRASLDVGFWSPIAEAWYQDILSKYRAGTLQPRRPKEWTRYLVGWDRRAITASRRISQAAEEIIAAYTAQ